MSGKAAQHIGGGLHQRRARQPACLAAMDGLKRIGPGKRRVRHDEPGQRAGGQRHLANLGNRGLVEVWCHFQEDRARPLCRFECPSRLRRPTEQRLKRFPVLQAAQARRVRR